VERYDEIERLLLPERPTAVEPKAPTPAARRFEPLM
jgi:hypothetical protein